MTNNLHYFGISGLFIGVIAIIIAIFQGDIRAAVEPLQPTDNARLKELVVDAGKLLIKQKILGIKEKQSAPDEIITETHNWVQFIYIGLGILAIILGVISWINKEHIRLSGAAISLGLIAVAWQYVLIAVVIAVIILILSNAGA
ncbi:hypothetical protein MNBD_GAMMA09-3444 [hydrothermal vent metagenome]|uniref:Inner membrane protein n=1 Tax=hydrothermal vent metagenome TaxID=652676 RepID=A0A3B0XPZ5_9ZZZZ